MKRNQIIEYFKIGDLIAMKTYSSFYKGTILKLSDDCMIIRDKFNNIVTVQFTYIQQLEKIKPFGGGF